MTAPTTERIAALDLARGIAILGTFALNVWLFADPGGPAHWFASITDTPAGPPDAIGEFLQSLVTGKFLAILSLLFGVGIELQYRAAQRRGRPWPGRYPVRAGVLFLEGLVHYLLVFEADVLMSYALTSLLVAWLVTRSDRAVRVVMIVLGAGFVASMVAVTAYLITQPAAVAGPADPLATASWTSQVANRITGFGVYRLETVMIIPSTTVLFLVGGRLLRAGLFSDGATGARLRRRLLRWGFGVGIPLTVIAATAGPAWVLVGRYLVPPIVAIGILAGVASLALRSRGGFVRHHLSAVGRTALSCYVAQNLVAGVLCYRWGFGLATRFADVRPWWVIGLWLAVSALVIALAGIWLRRHDRGPIELLMHRATADRRAVAPVRS